MAYLLDSGLAIALNNTPTTATRASGGASGSTSVVISAANANIAYDQTITGTGFAANTKVTSVNGTTVNFSPAATGNITGTLTFATTWYKLTDHNRQSIEITSQLIEKESRMANGTMRKFVVAKKDTISTSWEFLPANDSTTVKSPIISGGSTSLVVSYVPVGVKINQKISATGLSLNTTITGISGTTINFSPTAVGPISGNASFFINDLLVDYSSTNDPITDKKYSASWITSFYNANAGLPIYLKITSSNHNDTDLEDVGTYPDDSTYKSSKETSKIYNVFITNFSKTISKRTRTTDYVDMSIEFTEV